MTTAAVDDKGPLSPEAWMALEAQDIFAALWEGRTVPEKLEAIHSLRRITGIRWEDDLKTEAPPATYQSDDGSLSLFFQVGGIIGAFARSLGLAEGGQVTPAFR